MFEGGEYLCVRDRAEAEIVCGFIRGKVSADALMEKLGKGAGPGFDPERHLQKIGLANQTTMLMSESLEIQDLLRAAMRERWGEAELAARFRAFDTICSATQDRQDAIHQMLAKGGLDVIVVVGGYNSSNTQALARMCREAAPTYHVDSAERLTPASIQHRPLGSAEDVVTAPWVPEGPIVFGLTAGASTPNSVVGEVIRRLLALRGRSPEELAPEG
jgi:4-hydroxy-3-methylbut-2-enyl diphosphate reductase